MTVRGIPTAYKGINFRSRAEARWAAFFDALCWPWQYEPIDLAGYIPDFIIQWPSPLLVEIKGGAMDIDAIVFSDASNKIVNSGWAGPYAVFGACPIGGDVGQINNRGNGLIQMPPVEVVKAAWPIACNATQWVPAKTSLAPKLSVTEEGSKNMFDDSPRRQAPPLLKCSVCSIQHDGRMSQTLCILCTFRALRG